MSAALLVACLVIGVADGDSLKVKCDEREPAISVRLAEIDAPEIAHKAFGIAEQPGGRESRAALAALCLKQPATVRRLAFDRYRRTVAVVTCNGVNANAAQVRAGMAWAYTATLRARSKMPALETAARAEKLGVWADPAAVAPWTWRKKAPA